LPCEALLREHIEADKIGQPYDQIPLARFVAFFEAAAVISYDAALGARIGMTMDPEEVGPLGVIFMAAPDLGTALDRLGFFLRAWQGGTIVELETRGSVVEWSYQIEDPTIRPRRQDAEFSLSVTCNMIRALLGSDWAPLEVHLEHSIAGIGGPHRDALQRLFGAPVLFNRSLNRLVFDRADLTRQGSRPPQPMAPYLEQHLGDLMRSDPEEDFSQRVSFIVARRLGQRKIDRSSLARELGISTRTLQRRLSEEGTTLRAIVRVERNRMAEALLQTSRTPIVSIAHDLGYSDTAIFSRAFKSWRGETPRSFRRAAPEQEPG
jgi:AraC-like DNA-binding protein